VAALLLSPATGAARDESPATAGERAAPDDRPVDSAQVQTASNQSVSLSADPPTIAAGEGPQDPAVPPRSMTRRPPEVAAPAAASGSRWYGRGLTPLALVLAAIAVTCLAVRRLLPGRTVGDGGVLRVVARTALSPRHSVALIQVAGERMVLVGITSDGVTALAEIRSADALARLAGRLGPEASSGAFRDAIALSEREFEEAAEDVGDGLAPDPPALGGARVRLGELRERLQCMRQRVAH